MKFKPLLKFIPFPNLEKCEKLKKIINIYYFKYYLLIIHITFYALNNNNIYYNLIYYYSYFLYKTILNIYIYKFSNLLLKY